MRFAILVPLAVAGVYLFAKDLRRAWRSRGDQGLIARLERARVIAVLLALASLIPVVPAAFLRAPPWVFILCFSVLGTCALGYLVLSAAVGFIEGYRARARDSEAKH